MLLSLRVLLLFTLTAAHCSAAEIVEVQVEHEDDAYHIYFEVLLNAPRDRVVDVITDYVNMHELSDSVTRSEVESVTAEEVKLDLTLRPCVWLLCRNMRKTTTASINAYDAIVYNTIPEYSDFREGKEQVIVKSTAKPGQTRITYNARLVPDFFVPPLVGSWLIRRSIVKDLETSNARLEQRANK